MMILLPSNVGFKLVSAAKVELEVEQLLANILADYCKRFKVKVDRKKKFQVEVAMVNIPGYAELGCAFELDDGRILVQIKDPYLEEGIKEDNLHPYTNAKYIEVMCHEFVHVCQGLTNRRTLELEVKHNKKDDLEGYYFDPSEMEARLLESFYANKFAYPLLMEDINETTNVRY
jgi:hypothetical protein